MPVHNEADSSIPPIIAPSKFEPSASAENPARAKLRIKIIPAKKTGRHRDRMDTRILVDSEAKKIARTGRKKPSAKVANKPAYATAMGSSARKATSAFAAKIRS